MGCPVEHSDRVLYVWAYVSMFCRKSLNKGISIAISATLLMSWMGLNRLSLSCLLLHLIWFGGRSPVAVVAFPSRPIKQRNTHSLAAPKQRHVLLWLNLICC